MNLFHDVAIADGCYDDRRRTTRDATSGARSGRQSAPDDGQGTHPTAPGRLADLTVCIGVIDRRPPASVVHAPRPKLLAFRAWHFN